MYLGRGPCDAHGSARGEGRVCFEVTWCPWSVLTACGAGGVMAFSSHLAVTPAPPGPGAPCQVHHCDGRGGKGSPQCSHRPCPPSGQAQALAPSGSKRKQLVGGGLCRPAARPHPAGGAPRSAVPQEPGQPLVPAGEGHLAGPVPQWMLVAGCLLGGCGWLGHCPERSLKQQVPQGCGQS